MRAVRRLDSNVPAKEIALATADMGQRLFFPPSVKGWDGGGVWINAGTWTARHNALARLVEKHADLELALGKPRDRREAASMALEALLPGLAEPAFASALESEVRREDSPEEALRLAAALIVTSPEYQLI